MVLNEEFPHNKWYLKIDDENREEVNNWRINIIKYSITPCTYPYINWNGAGRWIGSGGGGRVEITTQQFRGHVLKISETTSSEISSNLTNLLIKMGIT